MAAASGCECRWIETYMFLFGFGCRSGLAGLDSTVLVDVLSWLGRNVSSPLREYQSMLIPLYINSYGETYTRFLECLWGVMTSYASWENRFFLRLLQIDVGSGKRKVIVLGDERNKGWQSLCIPTLYISLKQRSTAENGNLQRQKNQDTMDPIMVMF